MTVHQTTVAVRNPSSDSKLSVSKQGQQPQKVKEYNEYTDDTTVGLIAPHSHGSIGGGQFHFDRRFLLIADGPTLLEIVSRDNNFIVEKLTTGTDEFGPYDADVQELAPAKAGTKYLLDAGMRVSIRINPKDESNDGAYVNFRNLGGAGVRVVQQTKREIYRRSHATSWLEPVLFSEVAPGATSLFVINDNSRLVLETDSEQGITLTFANTNFLHCLQLRGKDGTVNIPKSEGAGVGYASGQITIRKGQSCIVQQAAQ